MDILRDNIFNEVNGYIISESVYLDKFKIFKVYTDKFGLISIYIKNIETYLSIFSKYRFKLKHNKGIYYCNDYEIVEFIPFKSKDNILFINILIEVILKTNLQELKNFEIYNLIEEISNINYSNYKIVLTYFFIKYLIFNGYHISFDSITNIEDVEYFYFDIIELSINLNSINDNHKFNYRININEYRYIYFLYNLKSFENINLNDFNVNFLKILKIMLNALCLNFNIYKLNTFNLR